MDEELKAKAEPIPPAYRLIDTLAQKAVDDYLAEIRAGRTDPAGPKQTS